MNLSSILTNLKYQYDELPEGTILGSFVVGANLDRFPTIYTDDHSILSNSIIKKAEYPGLYNVIGDASNLFPFTVGTNNVIKFSSIAAIYSNGTFVLANNYVGAVVPANIVIGNGKANTWNIQRISDTELFRFHDMVYGDNVTVFLGESQNASLALFSSVITTNDFINYTGNVKITDQFRVTPGTPYPKIGYGNGVYIVHLTSGNNFISNVSNAGVWYGAAILNSVPTIIKLTHQKNENQFFAVTKSNVYFGTRPELLNISLELPASQTITSFTDINGVFYYTASNSFIGKSNDGISWTTYKVPDTNNRTLWGIIEHNNTFITVGERGIIAKATDMNTWNIINPFAHNVPQKINYINGKFVIVYTGGEIRVSDDGYNWTSVVIHPNITTLTDIAYGNGIYVITASGGNVCVSSNIYSQWYFYSTNITSNPLEGIIYDGSKFICIGTSQRQLLTSTNGNSWVTVSVGNNGNGHYRIAYGNGQYVMTNAVGSSNDPIDTISVSLNGTTWMNVNVGKTSFGNSYPSRVPVYANGSFVFGSAAQGIFAQSTGNINSWSEILIHNKPRALDYATFTPSNPQSNYIRYQNNQYIVLEGGDTILVSNNLTDWKSIRHDLSGSNIRDIAYGNGVYVLITPHEIMTTSNIEVTPQISLSTSNIFGIHKDSNNNISYAYTMRESAVNPINYSLLQYGSDIDNLKPQKINYVGENIKDFFTAKSNLYCYDGYTNIFRYNTASEEWDYIPSRRHINNLKDCESMEYIANNMYIWRNHSASGAGGFEIYYNIGPEDIATNSNTGFVCLVANGSTLPNFIIRAKPYYFNNTMFATTYASGAPIIKSNNFGNTWSIASNIVSFSTQTSKSLIYGDGIYACISSYIAGAEQGVIGFSSDGGNTFSKAISFSNLQFQDIAYGSNTFVAVGYSSAVGASPLPIMYSRNSNGTMNVSNFLFANIASINLFSVIYSQKDNVFIAGGEDGSLFTSSNGLEWGTLTTNLPKNRAITKIYFDTLSNTYFCILGGGAVQTSSTNPRFRIVASSKDMVNWKYSTPFYGVAKQILEFNNNVYILTSNANTSEIRAISNYNYGDMSQNTFVVNKGFSSNIQEMKIINNKLIFSANAGVYSHINTNENKISNTIQVFGSSNASKNANSMPVYYDNYYYFYNENIISRTSKNLLNILGIDKFPFGTITSIAYGNGIHMVSVTNEVYKSTTGTNWDFVFKANSHIQKIKYENNLFFAIANGHSNGTIHFSSDGNTWNFFSQTVFSNGTVISNTTNDIVFLNNVYMKIIRHFSTSANLNATEFSYDFGNTWVQNSLPALAGPVHGAIAGNNKFLIYGWSNATAPGIYYSEITSPMKYRSELYDAETDFYVPDFSRIISTRMASNTAVDIGYLKAKKST